MQAELFNQRAGLVDNWLRHVRDVLDRHQHRMDRVPEERKLDALCELNAIEQVVRVSQTTVVVDAWSRGQDLTLHGWVYGISDGLAHDMDMTVRSTEEVRAARTRAIARWESQYCE